MRPEFYLETSERSLETHAVWMPIEVAPGHIEAHEATVCGSPLDATWSPFQGRDPWPSCTKCMAKVEREGWPTGHPQSPMTDLREGG